MDITFTSEWDTSSSGASRDEGALPTDGLKSGIDLNNVHFCVVVRKGCQKTRDVLIDLIRHNPRISQAAMASTLSISRQAVQKHLAALKASGHLRRIGPDKGGRWVMGHA